MDFCQLYHWDALTCCKFPSDLVAIFFCNYVFLSYKLKFLVFMLYCQTFSNYTNTSMGLENHLQKVK